MELQILQVPTLEKTLSTHLRIFFLLSINQNVSALSVMET